MMKRDIDSLKYLVRGGDLSAEEQKAFMALRGVWDNMLSSSSPGLAYRRYQMCWEQWITIMGVV